MKKYLFSLLFRISGKSQGKSPLKFPLLLGVLCLCASYSAAQGISPEMLDSLVKANQSASVPQGPFSAPVACAEQHENKIFLFKPNSDWNSPDSILWSWEAADSPEILPEHQSWFRIPDECKPVLGTSHLLMTASGNGVALVRLADKKCLFYAYAGGNPHSAELLPDGNVVSVSSAGYFTVYAVPETFTSPDVPTKTYPLTGGHGIVWDAKEKRLWVLGSIELAKYRYNFDKKNPDFTKELSIPVHGTAAAGGHDLYPIPGQRGLFVTGTAVGVFDLETHQFTTIRKQKNIKSVSLSPEGALLYLSPTKRHYAPHAVFPDTSLTPMSTRGKARIYKARWWIPNHLTFQEF